MILDAFLVAFALPNLLRNLFGEGALSAAFIPRYIQERERDPVAADVFAGAVVTRLAIGLTLLAGAGMAVAALLLAHGSGKIVIVAAMAIPQIPYLIFVCVVAIMAGALNGRRHFWVPAAAPVILNICMIVTIGMDVEDEAWLMPYAVLSAGVLQMALHLWALRRTGGVPPLSVRATAKTDEMRRAVLPVVVASGIYQVNALLDSIIAMALIPGAGAVSFLYFGNRLLQFPMALIGHGVTTAAYPELARRAGEGWPATGEGLREAAKLQSFWLLPAAVGLLATAEPLVRTIYQTGNFGAESVARTVLVTQMLGLALVPISMSKLLVRAFHAHRDQRTPMIISLWMVALNLALNVILVVATPLREAGLALATAIASFVGCAIYLVILKQRGCGHVVSLVGLARPAVAAGVMGIAVLAMLHWWPQPAHRASGFAALRLVAAVVLGAVVYLPIAGTGWLRRKRAGPAIAAADPG